MRHRMAGNPLNRTTAHRTAMFRNMAISLFQHGAIRTTAPKAKELRRFVEKLITTAKKNDLAARRRVSSELGNIRVWKGRPAVHGDRGRMYDDEGTLMDQTLLQRIFDDIVPRYADRTGGYTRIIRLAERRLGDAGEQVVLQLVEESASRRGGGSSKRRQRADKRREAAAAVGTGPQQPAKAEPEATAAPEAPADQAEGEKPQAE